MIVVAAFVVLIYDYRVLSAFNPQLRLDSRILKVLTFDREVWVRANGKRSCADVSAVDEDHVSQLVWLTPRSVRVHPRKPQSRFMK